MSGSHKQLLKTDHPIAQAILTCDAEYIRNTKDLKPDTQFNISGLHGNSLHLLGARSEYSFEESEIPRFYYPEKKDYKPNYSDDDYEKIVAALLQRGVILYSFVSFFNQYPLHTAIAFDNTGVALALIKADRVSKVTLNAKNHRDLYGTTPLLLAVQRGNQTIIDVLIQNKVNVNDAAQFGLTPLHWAAIMRLPNAIQSLINAGADIHAKDEFGKAPIDYYCEEIKVEDIMSPTNESPEGYTNRCKNHFYPIYAHFNNNVEAFCRIRNNVSILNPPIQNESKLEIPNSKKQVTQFLSDLFIELGKIYQSHPQLYTAGKKVLHEASLLNKNLNLEKNRQELMLLSESLQLVIQTIKEPNQQNANALKKNALDKAIGKPTVWKQLIGALLCLIGVVSFSFPIAGSISFYAGSFLIASGSTLFYQGRKKGEFSKAMCEVSLSCHS